MSVALSLWDDEVLVNAPGAAKNAVTYALERTVAQFLRDSGAWVEQLPDITLRANKSTYYLDAAGLGPILFVHSIYYDGAPLNQYTSTINTPTDSGTTPSGWRGTLRLPSQITFYPAFSEAPAKPAIAFVAIGYDPTCKDRLPDIFSSHWYDVILSGALFRLLAQQNKPYSDPTLALVHGKKFRAGIAQARDMGRRQFMSVDTGFTFPYWA